MFGRYTAHDLKPAAGSWSGIEVCLSFRRYRFRYFCPYRSVQFFLSPVRRYFPFPQSDRENVLTYADISFREIPGRFPEKFLLLCFVSDGLPSFQVFGKKSRFWGGISAMPDSEPEDDPVFRNGPEPLLGCPFISDGRYLIEEKSTVTISRDGRNGL